METINLLSLFLFLLSSPLVFEVYSLDSESIIGGDSAAKGQFPYQVSVEIWGIHVCGGAIIDETHVIAAAHCVIDKKANDILPYPFRVVGATNDIHIKDSTVQASYVEKVFVTTKYLWHRKKAFGIGDIAVLRLETPLNLKGNPYLTKLELPDPNNTYVDDTAIVTGYGYDWMKTQVNNETGKLIEIDGGGSGKLRFARTTVLSTASCQRNYGFTISDDLLCARVHQNFDSLPAGVCSGDSGGPLVYNNRVLIGVVSVSPAGCHEDVAAGIYTRVSSFLGFIKKALNDQSDDEVASKVIETRVLDYGSMWN